MESGIIKYAPAIISVNSIVRLLTQPIAFIAVYWASRVMEDTPNIFFCSDVGCWVEQIIMGIMIIFGAQLLGLGLDVFFTGMTLSPQRRELS